MADEDKVQITPREKWSGVFGGTEIEFKFEISSSRALEAVAKWSYSASNRQVIRRGEALVKAKADEPGMLTLQLPSLRATPGVVVQTNLAIRIYEDESKDPVAKLEKPIWIFPRDPFHERTEWLEELKITLFDPEGDTIKHFDDAKIPFNETRNIAALEEVKEGLVVVGEGTSMKDYRGLADTLKKVAAKGVPVLCLAPRDGIIPLPGSDVADDPAPKRVTLRRADVITELDKKLDSEAWPPEGKVVVSGLTIKSDRDEVVAEVANENRSWPWLEAEYDGAKLIVCGFGIIKHWDDGPTPRFLLSRLFELLEKKKKDETQPVEK